MTVDGAAKTYGDLYPTLFSKWVDNGGSVTYSYTATVTSSTTGKQFVSTGVTGPASPISVSGAVTVTLNYKTQYKLTLATNLSGVGVSQMTAQPSSPDGFYDSGTSVDLTADATVRIDSGSRYAFNYWSDDARGTSNHATVTTCRARSVTANYETQDLLTVKTNGLPRPLTTTVEYQNERMNRDEQVVYQPIQPAL